LLFFLLWVTPPWQSQLALLLHFDLLCIAFDAAFTAVGVPYDVLAPEMTLDYDERTSLIAYQQVVSIGGGLVGAVLPLTIVGLFPGQRVGFMVMGALFGVLFVLLGRGTVALRPDPGPSAGAGHRCGAPGRLRPDAGPGPDRCRGLLSGVPAPDGRGAGSGLYLGPGSLAGTAVTIALPQGRPRTPSLG